MRKFQNNILYIKIGKRLKINIGFIALLIYSCICGFSDVFIISYLTAALHEAAHIAAAKRLGVGIARVEIMPFGVSAKLTDSIIKNPNHEILVAAAGPALNLIIALIILIFKMYIPLSSLEGHMQYAANINLALCTVNLIPALPLDGGRIFKAALSKLCGTVRAYNTAVKLSRVLIFLILAAAVAIFLTADFNFSLILIGVFMLGNLSYEQRAINMAAIREFIFSDSKIDSNIAVNIKPIAIRGSMPARLMLKKLNFSRYYLAVIIDEQMKIKKVVTESEIINALVKKGVLISIDEV